jgi:RsiW-degrading membrane proteinase PrsW (M82 family)
MSSTLSQTFLKATFPVSNMFKSKIEAMTTVNPGQQTAPATQTAQQTAPATQTAQQPTTQPAKPIILTTNDWILFSLQLAMLILAVYLFFKCKDRKFPEVIKLVGAFLSAVFCPLLYLIVYFFTYILKPEYCNAIPK